MNTQTVEYTCSAGDLGLIPGLGGFPEGGHGNPLQYSCLENPHGQRSLVCYSPWGLQRVGHDWVTKHTWILNSSCEKLSNGEKDFRILIVQRVTSYSLFVCRKTEKLKMGGEGKFTAEASTKYSRNILLCTLKITVCSERKCWQEMSCVCEGRWAKKKADEYSFSHKKKISSKWSLKTYVLVTIDK